MNINKKILLLLIISIVILCVSIIESNFMIFVMFLIFLFLGIFVCYLEDKSLIFKVFIPAFVIRILFVILLYYIFYYFNGIPFIINITGTTDDYHYFEVGKEVCNAWMNHGSYNWSREFNYPGYIYTIGGLNYFTNLFGQFHHIIVLLFNCLVGSISIIYVYKISQLIFGDKVAKTASTICIYFPYLLYYSSLILKDTIIYTLILAIIYYIYYLYYKKFDIVRILLLLLLMYILLYFRSFSTYLIITIFGIFSATKLLLRKKTKKPTLRLIFLVFFILLIIIIFKFNIFQDMLNILQNFTNKIAKWDARVINVASKDSLYAKYIIMLPPIIKEIVKVIYLLIMPIPFWKWNINGLFNINLFCEGISGLILNIFLPFFVIGVITASSHKFRQKSYLLLLNIVFFIILLGIIIPFPRYRIQILPCIIIFCALGIINKYKYKWIIELYLLLWCMIYITYITIKYNFLVILILTLLVAFLIFYIKRYYKKPIG